MEHRQRHQQIVTMRTVAHAFPPPEHANKHETTSHMRRSVQLRVRLIQAVGGEGNHHPVTSSQIDEMQRIIEFRNPPSASEALAYLESLKPGAVIGTPEHTGYAIDDLTEAIRTRLPGIITQLKLRIAKLMSSDISHRHTGQDAEVTEG